MDVLRYTLFQRLLHWAIAILVIGALIGGSVLWIYGFQGLMAAVGGEMTNAIYTTHKTVGVLILGLMLVRVVTRLSVGVPPPDPSLTAMERLASSTVHLLLYVAVIAMASLGWLATGAGGFPVSFFNATLPPLLSKNEALSETLFQLHGATGVAVFLLTAAHVAGAVRHWKVKRDGVMARMSLT